MKLTVKDCLELNAFAGAEVLTHREGLAGNVSSVSVFDSADEEDLKFMGLLLDVLEEDDDVLDVYHNWENCDR